MKIFIISLFIIVSFSQPPPLPGLDHLMSGFDGAKFLNPNEGQAQFKLFDIPLDGGSITLNSNKQYTSSKYVQVTELSKKTEDTCEGAYFTYSEFYRKYVEESTSGFGFSIGGVGIAYNYHKELLEIYQSITVNKKAVGVSQVWWGMYSITSAPSYLLPLNKMFVQSLDYLQSNAKNPTTEEQQKLYNQVIEAFGTHYVSNVIMGARVRTYTLVNSSFHQKYDYRELKEQIGFEFQFNVLKFKRDHSAEEILNKTMKEFRDNADSTTYFTPAPIIQGDQAEWNAWEGQAQNSPQVLNSTLSLLSDLAHNYPEVQIHLKKTIQFYVVNGVLPKLSDVGMQRLFFRAFVNSIKSLDQEYKLNKFALRNKKE